MLKYNTAIKCCTFIKNKANFGLGSFFQQIFTSKKPLGNYTHVVVIKAINESHKLLKRVIILNFIFFIRKNIGIMTYDKH
jgi:hypothetical protein